MDRCPAPFRLFLCSPLFIGLSFTSGCAPVDAGSPVLQADVPLHLEDHVDAATVVGSEVPDDVPQAITWDFAEPQPEWKVVERWKPEQAGTELSRTEAALRISVGEVDVTDDDIKQQTSFAAKIDAVTDAARLLPWSRPEDENS